MVALQHVPPVVAAPLDEINLLPAVLPDVAGPEIPGVAVKAEPPRVAQAVCPDLTAPAARREGIVRRDGVGLFRGRPGHVDAQDRPEQRCRVLPVAQRVAGRAAVAQADVQVAVRPERDLPAVVVGVGLLHLQDHQFAVRISARMIVGDGETRDYRPSWPCRGVVDVQVRLIRGVQRQSQQSLFRAPVADPVAYVQELDDVEAARTRPVERPDPPVLLGHEHPAVSPLHQVGGFPEIPSGRQQRQP